MQWPMDTLLHLGLTMAAAAPLLYASVSKLLAPERFALALPAFRVALPARPLSATAIGVAELGVAATALLIPQWPSAALLMTAYLGFAFLLARARRNGAVGDCGCFGALPTRIDGLAITRNVGLGFAAAAITAGRAIDMLGAYSAAFAVASSVALVLLSVAADTALTIRVATKR